MCAVGCRYQCSKAGSVAVSAVAVLVDPGVGAFYDPDMGDGVDLVGCSFIVFHKILCSNVLEGIALCKHTAVWFGAVLYSNRNLTISTAVQPGSNTACRPIIKP